MRRGLSLLLTVLVLFQLCLPVQALEAESDVSAQEDDAGSVSEETSSETPEAEDTASSGEDAALTDASGDTAAADGVSEPSQEETAAQPDADDLASADDSDSEAAEAGASQLPEAEDTAAAEEALYGGYEADYEDPQFLKLLENGFFEENPDAGISAASTGTSHSSRFNGYNIYKGVDISKWNTITSWSSLASAVNFAIIRCGNRTVSGGSLSKDDDFDSNMKNALAAGLKVGVYIYSQAITEEEAREEARFALERCKGYSFTLPIVIDYEYYGTSGRLYNAHLSNAERTSICRAFCEVIEAAGYPAMIYANKSMLVDDMDGESLVDAGYEIWLAHWVAATDYSDTYTYWQYTDSGSVSGIEGNVDANYRYELPKATLSRTYSSKKGVELYWNQVSAAKEYLIYRKTSDDEDWTLLATVTGSGTTSYVDQTAVLDTSYRYTVQAKDGNITADYDTAGTSVTYRPQVVLSSAAATPTGVKLTWEAESSYSGYILYRKTGASGKWTRLAQISDPAQNCYLDTELLTSGICGTVYTYTIRGIQNGSLVEYDAVGCSVTYLATPALSSAAMGTNGIRVTWKAVSDADRYCVYRKNTGGWTLLATVSGADSTSYLDREEKTLGSVYTYTVVACQGSRRSNYNRTGVSAMQLDTPQLGSVTLEAKGVRLTWKAAAKAEKYLVYRKSGTDSWKQIAVVSSGTSYLDETASFNETYTYTVRSYCSGYRSHCDTTGLSILRLATPEPSVESASAASARVTWPAVSGAVKYRVYRRTADSSWSALGTVTDNCYLDASGLTVGTTYYYTVRAYDSSGTVSAYLSPGAAYVHLAVPALKSVTVKPTGVEVTWGTVSGASGYLVYRRTDDSDWTQIAAVQNSGSYLDTSAVSGVTNYYTVQARCDSNCGWYHTDGLSQFYLAVPANQKAYNNASGLYVRWDAVDGASSYYVYRKTAGGGWSRVAVVTGTSYTDTAAVHGISYTYTIRARCGSAISDYVRAGVTCLCITAPVLRSASNTVSGVRIQWNAVSGAQSYIVYRKTDGGWTKLGTTTATSYTDTGSVSGTACRYTVRAYQDGTMSQYNSGGVSLVYLAVPANQKAYNNASGLCVRWDAVSGATSYYVYRKTAGGSWTRAAIVTGTSYTDTAAVHGVSYTYTIRAHCDGAASDYDRTGVSALCLAAPALQSAVRGSGCAVVTWSAISGIDQYIVYRKAEGGSWVQIGKTTQTSYTDTAVPDAEGVYYYTVRGCKGTTLGAYASGGILLS